MCASESRGAGASPVQASDTPLVQVIGVSSSYDAPRQRLFGAQPRRKVLDGIDLSIAKGEIFGLVGESGCGKTTLSRAMLGLIDYQGRIVIDGESFGGRQGARRDDTGGAAGGTAGGTGGVGGGDDAGNAGGVGAGQGARRSRREQRLERARRIQAVFQNPGSALNPAKRVGWLVEEPLRIHGWDKARRSKRVVEVLEQVGLEPSLATRRTNELSGGQKQRVCIACALALSPRILIADEATSALDVSVAAQILNLFGDLHARLGLTILFISHNLEVVYYLCDRIAVMSEGRIVEQGTAQQIYDAPQHPYTRALLEAAPSIP